MEKRLNMYVITRSRAAEPTLRRHANLSMSALGQTLEQRRFQQARAACFVTS
jgi:hypothetical protein